MDDEQLKNRLNEYKALVQKYIPDSAEDHYFLRSNINILRFRAAYLEVVVDLDGNEDDFKRCLHLAEAPEKNLHNYDGDIGDLLSTIKAYARMIKNNK